MGQSWSMSNVWQELPKPIMCLAPMEAVTDSVFRRVVVKCGQPAVMFSEFTNVEGLFEGVGRRRGMLASKSRLRKDFSILKKFFKIYCLGFEGAATLRSDLMETDSLDAVERIIAGWVGKAGLVIGEVGELEVDQEDEGWLGNREQIEKMGFVLGPGFDRVAERLWFTPQEKPLVAQIWGSKPENYYKAAQLVVKMGFDGVDINMGCPDKSVIRQGLGSKLVQDKQKAADIVKATKLGLAGKLPISVKIRIGYKEVETESWSRYLLEQGIDALIVHGRTTKQMSKVPADWNEIAKVVKMRDQLKLKTVIIGNGDVTSLSEAKQKVFDYGVDGVMIGRGIFGNPWLFGENKNISGNLSETNSMTDDEIKNRLSLLLWHARLFDKVWGVS